MNPSRRTQKTTLEPEVLGFAQEVYKEHLRRIKASRLRAATGAFIWPLLGLLSSGIPLFFVAFFSQLFLGQYPEKFQQVLAVEHHGALINGLWAFFGFGTFVGAVMGLFHGIHKSRQALFEAESLELKLRSQYYERSLCSAVLSTEKSEG